MTERITRRPLINEPGVSDPHALVTDGTCYLFTGHDIGFGVNDWIMPDWRIFRSRDLEHWDFAGAIDPADTYMGAGITHCWAGDIATRHGRYYWFFSHHDKETGVMVAEEPQGPYRDALGKALVDSFDPTIFVDDDGTAYIVYGAHRYMMAPLRESMIELAEPPRPIQIDRKGTFPSMDKNSLHKYNGIYYLSCSGYYAVSDKLYGPYEYMGLVGTGYDLDTPYAHGDFFAWRDGWYHVWCAYRDRARHRIRDTYLSRVVYGADGSMAHDVSSTM